MKKIFTTLLILSGIYSVAFAQTKNTTEFGLNIGYNAASVAYSGSSENSDYTSGFNAGVSIEHYFSDRWSIKAKAIYDQKGWGNGFISYDDGTEVDGVNFHLNYLTIPVMANWHFGRTRNWYLHFGPYVGILLNSTESSNSGVDFQDVFTKTDIGLDLGLGVKFPVSKHVNLFIEVDGQGGFNNIFTEGESVQNVRSSINFGFSIPLR
jgi:outer membrane protein W